MQQNEPQRDDLDDLPEPPRIRRLRMLVTLLMLTMIAGVVVVAGTLFMRLSAPPGPALSPPFSAELPVRDGHEPVSLAADGDRLLLLQKGPRGYVIDVLDARTLDPVGQYRLIE